MKILVTRPQPGGDATAARLRDLGHVAVTAPLMVAEATAWTQPALPPAAILFTSAFAARLAGAVQYRAVPVFAVGAATARAATEAGFADVRVGGGTVQAVLDGLIGVPQILHLAGEDRTPVHVPAGLTVETRTVYRARLLPLVALPTVDWVLLFSPRTATHFAAEADRLGVVRSSVAIAAIGDAALAAAGTGWAHAVAAAHPDEDGLLAAIGIPCQ